jgi:hypothetical protein
MKIRSFCQDRLGTKLRNTPSKYTAVSSSAGDHWWGGYEDSLFEQHVVAAIERHDPRGASPLFVFWAPVCRTDRRALCYSACARTRAGLTCLCVSHVRVAHRPLARPGPAALSRRNVVHRSNRPGGRKASDVPTPYNI